MTTKTIFSVRYGSGTYTTQTVHGQRASATSSPEEAARRLASKLHPHEGWELKQVSVGHHGVRVFELGLKP